MISKGYIYYIMCKEILRQIVMVERGINRPGGRDCFNLSAFSGSNTQRVYRYFEHLTLNFTTSLLLLIFTD